MLYYITDLQAKLIILLYLTGILITFYKLEKDDGGYRIDSTALVFAVIWPISIFMYSIKRIFFKNWY